MKKTIFLTLSLILGFMTIILTSCGTDSVSTSTEKPFEALFADNSLSDVLLDDTTVNSGYYEFGFEFNVSKNGKVTQLGAKIPDAGSVRVVLWDLTDTSVIAQSVITVTAHTYKYVTLGTAVSLIVGKKYALTLLSNDWYYKHRTGFVDYVYPMVKGNINITKYGYRSALSSDPPIYMTVFTDGDIDGIADFTYETED